MSDINPVNSQALTPYTSTFSMTHATHEQSALPLLSSLTNSALQLSLSAPPESLLPRPSSPTEMMLHLQTVSALAETSLVPRSEPGIMLPSEADRQPLSPAVCNLTGEVCWDADTLPFYTAEEIDTAPDAPVSFLQKVASQMPHIAEKIYLNNFEQQKKTLQAWVCGDESVSTEAAAHAWHYFTVEFSASRYRAFTHIINISHDFSAADKQVLLRSLQRARVNNAAFPQDNAIAGTAAAAVQLSDLPAGSISEETIKMLAKFGATATELQQFKTHTNHAAILREKVKIDDWAKSKASLDEFMRKEKMSLQEETSLVNIQSEFLRHGGKLMVYIAEDVLSSLREKDEHEINFEYILSQSYNAINYLYQNYLHSMPRFELYKSISNHNLSLMDNRLTPPKKLELLRYRNHLPRLKNLLNNTYEKRRFSLLNNMPLMPLVFDISGERHETTQAVWPYGNKGLSFSFVDDLISNPDISTQRLAMIGLYSTLEMISITHTGEIPLDWMAPLSDATLTRIFSPSYWPNESSLPPGRTFNSKLRALQAVKVIGRQIIAGYNHSDLHKLLAWIKPSLNYPISDDDLAYCLFTDEKKYRIQLFDISNKIISSLHQGSDIHYPTEEIAQDLIAFCHEVTQSEANQLPSRTAKLSQRVNEEVPPDQVLSFAAQRFTVRLIQEDSSGDFLHWYDNEGQRHDQPPDDAQDAFLIRPGELIPLNHDGSQQEAIALEHGDNHSLLVALTDYRRESAWRREPRSQPGQDETVSQLEADMSDRAKKLNTPRQTKS